jgi:hypothetical protein
VNCDGEEGEGYESKLEPTLTAGVDCLWEDPVKTWTLGVKVVAQSVTRRDATERSLRSRLLLESNRCRPPGEETSAALCHI